MVFGLNSGLLQSQNSPITGVYTAFVAHSAAEEQKKPLSEVLKNAAKRAMGGGAAGAMAMFVNVGTLMWMRTTVNFQYAKGMSTIEALKFLYAEGGIRRFYRGVAPALIQGPLSRFGDTAANAGMMELWATMPGAEGMPTWAKTVSASAGAAVFRVFLMPVDCLKTTMQVQGAEGMALLGAKIKGPPFNPFVLYHGSIGAMTATFVGHYPWFFTYNMLDEKLEKYNPKTEQLKALGRSAFMGFCASAVSDTCSNSIRVVKTTKQTSKESITYMGALSKVVAADGISGLLFRGLVTKIISNGCQGMLFSVLWKKFMDPETVKKINNLAADVMSAFPKLS
jgi:hypothetical protein